VVDKSPTTPPRDYTAYSDIVKTGKKKIGVLYEKENYSQIVYKVMKW
jgi:sialidase-1